MDLTFGKNHRYVSCIFILFQCEVFGGQNKILVETGYA